MFRIPIEKYDEYLNGDLSNEKKQKIRDLFSNCNKLHSEEEFKEIEIKLRKACMMGDIELVKICLSETVICYDYKYTIKIDQTSNTASLITTSSIENLIVPRAIEHKSTEYLITSVIGTHPNIKTIKFDENSAVSTIYYDAFIYSMIEEIYFPASLRELKEGWCNMTRNLKKITISPLNGQFVMKDDKYLLGKTDPNSDEFDNLLFAVRDIKEISIPSNIKIISSFAFENCIDLKKVEISPNSNLQTIGSHAFSFSNIREIFIPSKVSQIHECAFKDCINLTKVEIPQNSNLQTIGSNTFQRSKIKEIYFPTSLRELKEGWCDETNNLTSISISPLNGQFIIKENKYLLSKTDPNSDEFDNLLFAVRNIKEISIPSNIKIISSFAFENCTNLKKVEISPNSNLQTIGTYAFSYSNIREIFIPSKVSQIHECAFKDCINLTKVEIPPNSNLQTIEVYAFSYSNIREIFIPSKVSKIRDSAFENCYNLTKVEIPPNSILQKIESNAFSESKINELFIPSKVSKICKDAFFSCTDLQIVEISEESELKSFPFYGFYECKKVIFMIPSSLKLIKMH